MMRRRLLENFAYLFAGISGRLGRRPTCPSCGYHHGQLVDRKYFHSLLECKNCRLLHRYPVETGQQMASMYNDGYVEPGLTTELPDDKTLSKLVDQGFRGTEKDFSKVVSIFRSLGLKDGARLLDFGANWGYASLQFAAAGYDVISYEISKPRAAFGSKLGLKIHTDMSSVGTGFDAVYSSHVLEHTPDPAESLRRQLSLVNPGGFVIFHTPNGSAIFRERNQRAFHLLWGRVHPVLLTERFVQKCAGESGYLVTTNDDPEFVSTWDQVSQKVDIVDGSNLFGVIRSLPVTRTISSGQ